MNSDITEGKWKQLKGDIQKKWGEMTNDEIDQIKGSREKFVGILQERYGKKREEAEREFDALRDRNL